MQGNFAHMTESELHNEMDAINRTIALAETVLNECDENGYVYAAIDISSAIDKLNAIKERLSIR